MTSTDFQGAVQRQRAYQLFAVGEYGKVVVLVKTLLQEQGKDPNLMHMLAVSLAFIGKYDEAITQIKRCLAIKPNDPGLLTDMARMRIGQGQFDESIRTYDRVLKTNPEFALAISGKANVLMRRGQHEQARALLEPYIAAGREDGYMAMVYAQAQLAAGEHQECIALAARHLNDRQLDLVNRRILLELIAKAYEKLGDYAKAFEAYTKSNEITAIPFDPAKYVAEVDEIISLFSAENMARLPRACTAGEFFVISRAVRSSCSRVGRAPKPARRAARWVEPLSQACQFITHNAGERTMSSLQASSISGCSGLIAPEKTIVSSGLVWVVFSSTMATTRRLRSSGWCAQKVCTVMPPMLWPTRMTGRSSGSLSITACRSSAKPSSE